MIVEQADFSTFGDLLFTECWDMDHSQRFRFVCPLPNFSHVLALSFLDVVPGDYVCTSLSINALPVTRGETVESFKPLAVWRPAFAGGCDFADADVLSKRVRSLFSLFYHQTKVGKVGTYTPFTLQLIKRMRFCEFDAHLRAIDSAIVNNSLLHGGLATQVIARCRLREFSDCEVPGPRFLVNSMERAITYLRLDSLLGPLTPAFNLITTEQPIGGY